MTTAERPELLPPVARWLHEAFYREGGYTYEGTLADISRPTAAIGPPQYFVLLRDDVAIGTATLDEADLKERPELTPWLANVFVVPEARGHGHVHMLIGAVEAACRTADVATLWLHTNTAERVYARGGWVAVERVTRADKPLVTLMRRDLQCGVPVPVSRYCRKL